MFVNSILDFCPIATKVSGRLGEGVTLALIGAVVLTPNEYRDGAIRAMS